MADALWAQKLIHPFEPVRNAATACELPPSDHEHDPDDCPDDWDDWNDYGGEGREGGAE